MTTLAANTSATITLDGDDVLTTDGNATFQITPTSGGKGEGYLTGHQTLGPYGQYVTIVLTSINNPITYSQASDTDAAEIARYGKDASGNITSLVSGDGIPAEIPAVGAPTYLKGPPPAWDSNAHYYGLVPGMTSSATEAFQRAVDNAASAGTDLRLGYGAYNLDGVCDVRAGYATQSFSGTAGGYKSAFKMTGRGRDATRIVQQTANTGCFRFFAEDPAVQWWNPVLEDFGVFGTDSVNSGAFAFQFGGAHR